MNVRINGRACRAVDHRDRGLHYGDGVFETMRVRRHAVRFLDFHLQRLQDACRRLAITAPDPQRLRSELERFASRRSDAVLKLIVTRGVGVRGYRPDGAGRNTRVLSLHALPQSAIVAMREPARVRMCRMRIGVNETLAGLKTLNRLESVLARAEWTDARIWEGLMCDVDDNIVCGTMSNLFIRRGAYLLTPRLDRCGIAGVMRRWVLGQAQVLGLRPLEGRLRWPDVANAEEAFMTNAVAGVVSVGTLHQGRVRVRFDERRIADRLRQCLESQ